MTDKTSTGDSYKYYKENFPNPVKKTLFNTINYALNQEVVDYLLLGEDRRFEFNARLGSIGVFKFKRKIGVKANGKLNAPVDWGKTKALKAQGILDANKVVYITDNYFIGFKWIKKHCNVKGHHAYKFKSSRTNGIESKAGANNKLRAILKDPLNHFKYPFFSRK